jgi:hypothetical protein
MGTFIIFVNSYTRYGKNICQKYIESILGKTSGYRAVFKDMV